MTEYTAPPRPSSQGLSNGLGRLRLGQVCVDELRPHGSWHKGRQDIPHYDANHCRRVRDDQTDDRPVHHDACGVVSCKTNNRQNKSAPNGGDRDQVPHTLNDPNGGRKLWLNPSAGVSTDRDDKGDRHHRSKLSDGAVEVKQVIIHGLEYIDHLHSGREGVGGAAQRSPVLQRGNRPKSIKKAYSWVEPVLTTHPKLC